MATETYVYGPAKGHTHNHTVILLHDRDSNADEFSGEFFECEASPSTYTNQERTFTALFPNIRWVFPTAPILHSRRLGMEIWQWFDMWIAEDPEERSEIQRGGLSQSIRMLFDVIRAEEEILSREKIFLGGISQGFATVLAALFAEGQGGFAGLIGLSSWMPFSNTVRRDIFQSSQEDDPKTAIFTALQTLYLNGKDKGVKGQLSPARIEADPVFLGHASDDEVISIENARLMAMNLPHMGLNVEWNEYSDGGHCVNEPEGVDDIVCFLSRYYEILRNRLSPTNRFL